MHNETLIKKEKDIPISFQKPAILMHNQNFPSLRK